MSATKQALRTFAPGDRVLVTAKIPADIAMRVGCAPPMEKTFGKYRVVREYFPGTRAVQFTRDKGNAGTGFYWPVEVLRKVRSAAQARAAAKRQRAKKKLAASLLPKVDKQQATATLKRWWRLDNVLWGNIHDDTKGRFSDGVLVRTSRIAGTTPVLKQGDLVQTANSLYLLGEPA